MRGTQFSREPCDDQNRIQTEKAGPGKKAVGDLDRVKRVIRLYGMVNCAPDFDPHMVVIDGASDLFYELWGPVYGQHARGSGHRGIAARRRAGNHGRV